MTAEERTRWARRVKRAAEPHEESVRRQFHGLLEDRAADPKLLLVVIVMFTVDYPAVCATLMCLNHALMCLFRCTRCHTWTSAPTCSRSRLVRQLLQHAARPMAFAQIVVEGIWWGVMFVNLTLPILMFLTGWWLNVRSAAARKADAEKYASVGGGDSYAMPGSNCRRAGGGRAVEPEAVAAARRRVERSINEYTLRFLVSWTAVVVLVPAERHLDRLVREAGDDAGAPHFTVAASRRPWSTARRGVRHRGQFIGFATWDNFTDHCCCMGGQPNASNANASDADLEGLVELWACAIDEPDPPSSTTRRRWKTNRTKIRTRSGCAATPHDGTFVRPSAPPSLTPATSRSAPADHIASGMARCTACSSATRPTTSRSSPSSGNSPPPTTPRTHRQAACDV